MRKYNIAVVGATGLVGGKILEVLKERNFPIQNLYLFASIKSAGKKIVYNNKEYVVETLSKESYMELLITCLKNLSPDIVIHRLTGDGPKDLLIAPTWSLYKRDFFNTLHRHLKQTGEYQGQNYLL